MSKQPQYTERERGVRCVAYPKVDDILTNRHLGVSMRVVSVDMNKYEFVAEYMSGELVTWEVYDPAWVFVDATVEAQRLMEAAYRADTSPFPEDLLNLLERVGGNIDEALRVIVLDMYASSPFLTPIAPACMEAVPHLLRWQAQQEGGAQ